MIFEEVSAATAAVYAEDGFVFFGRPLKVAYAREKSDRVAKQDGSFSKEVKEKRGRKRAAAEAATGGGESLAGVAQKHVKIEGGDGIIGAGGAVAVEGQQTVPDGPPSGGGAIPPPPPPPTAACGRRSGGGTGTSLQVPLRPGRASGMQRDDARNALPSARGVQRGAHPPARFGLHRVRGRATCDAGAQGSEWLQAYVD